MTTSSALKVASLLLVALAPAAPAADVDFARAMATLFGRVDAQLQLLLVGTGAGLPGTALLRSVVGA